MRGRRVVWMALWLLAASASADEPEGLGDGPDPGCLDAVHLAIAGPASPAPSAPTERDPVAREPVAQEPVAQEPVAQEPGVQETREPESVAPAPAPASRVPLPEGRAIGRLSAPRCHTLLRDSGVRFEPVEAAGVTIPVRVQSRLGGVEVRSRGGEAVHEIMDCRLAVAILAWAPTLRAAGVERVLHYSTYRPGARVGGTGRISGHARGLAIDLSVVTAEGEETDVLTGWESRARGAPPCHGEHSESVGSARLRRLVCDAVSADLFQVVLTPHYDRAHANHVHLEVVPRVTWSFIR